MHSKIFAVAAGVSLCLASFGAGAMPAGAVTGVGPAPHITLAAEGCGRGFAPGRDGICRPIARVFVRPLRPVIVVPRRVVPDCGIRVGPIGVRTPC